VTSSSSTGETADEDEDADDGGDGDDGKPPPKLRVRLVRGGAPNTESDLLLLLLLLPELENLPSLARNAAAADLLLQENDDARQRVVAIAVANALWARDFRPGKHWEIESTTAQPVVDGTSLKNGSSSGVGWTLHKSATWDWKDIYSVATLQGRVRFVPPTVDDDDEYDDTCVVTVRLEDYSYYVAG
jgi:hypothetical protein